MRPLIREAAKLRKVIENLRVEHNFLQERCLAAEEKEKATAHRIDVLSNDVVDLGQKMTKLILDLEEERSLRVKAKKSFDELRGFVIKQHDLGFDLVVR